MEMASEIENSAFGFAFLLFVFGMGTLILPLDAIESAREKPLSILPLSGMFLIFLMMDVLCATELFDITIPHRDHFLFGLLVAGFSLVGMVWPIGALMSPFRRVTELGFALLATGLALGVFSGLVRVIDSLLFWIVRGDRPGIIATALSFESWERPTFGLFIGVTLLVFAVVLLTTSPALRRAEETVETPPVGDSAAAPKAPPLHNILMAVVCIGVALYGFSMFSDAVLGTDFERSFEPIKAMLNAFDAIAHAWGFYAEWAGFVIVSGLLIWYTASEEEWGCLTTVLIGLVVYFTWAISSGLLEDWGGPMRGAWQEIVDLFR